MRSQGVPSLPPLTSAVSTTTALDQAWAVARCPAAAARPKRSPLLCYARAPLPPSRTAQRHTAAAPRTSLPLRACPAFATLCLSSPPWPSALPPGMPIAAPLRVWGASDARLSATRCPCAARWDGALFTLSPSLPLSWRLRSCPCPGIAGLTRAAALRHCPDLAAPACPHVHLSLPPFHVAGGRHLLQCGHREYPHCHRSRVQYL